MIEAFALAGLEGDWHIPDVITPPRSFDDQKYPAVKIHANLLCDAHATRLFDSATSFLCFCTAVAMQGVQIEGRCNVHAHA